MTNAGMVWTPDGIKYGLTRSLVGKGESLINYTHGKGTLVTEGKVGVDNQPSSITSSDDNVIAGNDPDWIGYWRGITPIDRTTGKPYSYAKLAAPITAQIEKVNAVEDKYKRNVKRNLLDSMAKQTDVAQTKNVNAVKQPWLAKDKEITDRQALLHSLLLNMADSQNIMMANNGKDILRFKAGTNNGYISPWMRYTAYGIPVILNGLQANYWRKQKVHTPDIYAGNPYERTALNTLASLRVNPYPISREMRDAERRNAYAITRAGGLSGALRYMALAGQALGSQRNIAENYVNNQILNNQYRGQYANALLSAGAQDAQRRMTANQYNAESYDRAASRRATNMWKSVAGVGQAIQQGFANENQYQSFQDLMNMYNHKMSNDELELMLRYPQGKPDNTPTVTTSDGAGTYVRNSSSNIFSKTAPTGYKWTNRGRGIREMIVDPEYIDANPSLQKYWNDNYGPFIVIPGTTNTLTPGAHRGGDYVNSIFPKITFE